MELHDLDNFFRLSARLNYQLNAAVLDEDAIINTLLGDAKLDDTSREVLKEGMGYLVAAYKKKRRRLGPVAVIHPLRATALLARASGRPSLLDLLTEFFHDKLEDICERDYDSETWKDLERRFNSLIQGIDPTDEWYLMDRLDHLTRREGDETYYAYIGRLLKHAKLTPELVRVKLADRLDNTLDMRISAKDPLEGVDFFENIFQLLFVRNDTGYHPEKQHPPKASFNGARRMYELFKNIITLSLVRQTKAASQDAVARRLVSGICTASMREVERIVTHIFGYHITDIATKRRIVQEARDYCYSGGVHEVTRPNPSNRLDGLLMERFDNKDPKKRAQCLDELYGDKELMVEAALTFLVIFMSFLNDPDFYLKGIGADGIYTTEKREAPSSAPGAAPGAAPGTGDSQDGDATTAEE